MDQLYLAKPRNKYGLLAKQCSTFSSEANEAVEKVKSETTYISSDIFDSCIKQTWKMFLEKKEEDGLDSIAIGYFLLFNSEQRIHFWPITLLDLNKEMEIVSTSDICNKENCILVVDYILDSEIIFDTMQKFIFLRFGKKNLPKVKYNIHLVCSFIKKDAIMKFIRQIRHNLYMSQYVAKISIYTQYRVDESSFDNENNEVLMKEYGATDKDMPCIYFDFEIPDKYSTYTNIYGKLLSL